MVHRTISSFLIKPPDTPKSKALLLCNLEDINACTMDSIAFWVKHFRTRKMLLR